MKLLQKFIQSSNDEEIWKAYIYATLLLVIPMISTILNAKYTERMAIIGMKLQTVLTSIIYKKSMKLSTSARKNCSNGEIVNLISSDVAKITALTTYVNNLWSNPILISSSVYFIYTEIEWAIFIGLAIMILAILFTGVIANMMKKFQQEQLKKKDQRIMMINEILGGINVLKLYGWEPSFVEQVCTIVGTIFSVIVFINFMQLGKKKFALKSFLHL